MEEKTNVLNDVLAVPVQALQKDVHSIELKIHNQYARSDLKEVREKIQTLLLTAEALYAQYCPVSGERKTTGKGKTTGKKKKNVAEKPIENVFNSDQLIANGPDTRANADIFSSIAQCFEKLGEKHDSMDISNPDVISELKNLYDYYRNLIYSFATARLETKNFVNAARFNGNENAAMILLCKNVRIMEDIINKICTNNIDKSIIGGDQQFDSIRYGFEWLFCHEDISVVADNAVKELKHLDIRDSNRYLDYIKYQIMVASKYVMTSSHSSEGIDSLFAIICQVFEDENHTEYSVKQEHIQKFKRNAKELIEQFFRVYELLITYRALRFREEEIRRMLAASEDEKDRAYAASSCDLINLAITNLSSISVRVLLDRFVSFVKINDLNFGNSTFKCAWFNYSELSRSNYAGSDFKYARIENARLKECDLSTCNMIRADAGNSDFSSSNFTYTNLCGVNFIGATLNNCEFRNAVFTDGNISGYKKAIEPYVPKKTAEGNDKRIKALYDIWKSEKYASKPISERLNSLLELVKKQTVPEDTASSALPDAANVLKCAFETAKKPNINSTCEVITGHFLSKYVSTELIEFIRQRLLKEDRPTQSERIRKYGKVYLDAANLRSASVKKAGLSELLLNRVCLDQSSFEDSDLSGTIMHYNSADSASFIACNLNKAECFESNFYLSNFSKAVINNSVFANCNLEHTNWNKSILVSTVFADFSVYLNRFFQNAETECQNDYFESILNNSVIDRDSYLLPPDYRAGEKANPFWQRNCTLNNATFQEALADRAVFISIFADRAAFNSASMRQSAWFNCQTDLADFIETDLRYSLIVCCRLTQSNFTRANLTKTEIRYVDFSNCNLYAALFNLSTIRHVLLENANTREMNFSGAEVYDSVFSNCKFENTILTNATFSNCLFTNVDFIDLVGFHSSEFKNCRFQNCTYKRGKHRAQRVDDTGNLREIVPD